MRWGWRIPPNKPINATDHRVQQELYEFLRLFDWSSLRDSWCVPNHPLIIADIGARNFVLAPVLDRHFQELGCDVEIPEIHGIEIDAYRRLINFHTRADYGTHYAKSIRRGYFHPTDFLQWRRPLNIGFLLNPFVTIEPLLSWGLPCALFRPKEIFRHAYHLLKPQSGILILSNPDTEERDLSYKIAEEVGFSIGQSVLWEPDDSAQTVPRYGTVLRV